MFKNNVLSRMQVIGATNIECCVNALPAMLCIKFKPATEI